MIEESILERETQRAFAMSSSEFSNSSYLCHRVRNVK